MRLLYSQLAFLASHLADLMISVGARNTTFCRGECQGRCGSAIESERDAIQAFYYPWYSYSLDISEKDWKHWNQARRVDGSSIRYLPPHDLPSTLYPKLGAYDSRDIDVIKTHMKWMKEAGIGVVIVSWWGVDSFEDRSVWDILHAADDMGIKVSFCVEPQGGYMHRSAAHANRTVGVQTPAKVQRDVIYLIEKYGCHRAFHRLDGRPVFLFFGAREYMNGKPDDWKLTWDKLHANAKYNPVVLTQDYLLKTRIMAGGWDGGFAYGCFETVQIAKHWKLLARMYDAAGKIFYFTICPGYDKSRLRPDSDRVQRVIEREDGLLYSKLWQTAIESKRASSVVAISTFNEWHEGTAIEPVIPFEVEPYQYKGDNFSLYVYNDYENAFGKTGEEASFAYLTATKKYSDQFLNTTASDEMLGA